MAAQPKQAQNAVVSDALARLESLQRGAEERMGNNIAVGSATTGLALASAGTVAAQRMQIGQALEALAGGGAGGDGEEPPSKKAKKADQKFEIVMELLVTMIGEVDGVKAWLACARRPALSTVRESLRGYHDKNRSPSISTQVTQHNSYNKATNNGRGQSTAGDNTTS